jgi:hypothetical protein
MNQKEKINKTIREYCKLYGIDSFDLHRKYINKMPYKLYKGVNLALIRQSLGYYIYHNYMITMSELSILLGYKDHSSLSNSIKKANIYLEIKDEKFLKYYQSLKYIPVFINN